MLFYYNPLNGNLHPEVLYRSYVKHFIFLRDLTAGLQCMTECRAPAQIKKVKTQMLVSVASAGKNSSHKKEKIMKERKVERNNMDGKVDVNKSFFIVISFQ